MINLFNFIIQNYNNIKNLYFILKLSNYTSISLIVK